MEPVGMASRGAARLPASSPCLRHPGEGQRPSLPLAPESAAWKSRRRGRRWHPSAEDLRADGSDPEATPSAREAPRPKSSAERQYVDTSTRVFSKPTTFAIQQTNFARFPEHTISDSFSRTAWAERGASSCQLPRTAPQRAPVARPEDSLNNIDFRGDNIISSSSAPRHRPCGRVLSGLPGCRRQGFRERH